MAKRNAAVDATLTLPGITRPVGRPRKANALSGAERSRRFRLRKLLAKLERIAAGDSISVARDGNSL